MLSGRSKTAGVRPLCGRLLSELSVLSWKDTVRCLPTTLGPSPLSPCGGWRGVARSNLRRRFKTSWSISILAQRSIPLDRPSPRAGSGAT